jgi:hypothetical protein
MKSINKLLAVCMFGFLFDPMDGGSMMLQIVVTCQIIGCHISEDTNYSSKSADYFRRQHEGGQTGSTLAHCAHVIRPSKACITPPKSGQTYVADRRAFSLLALRQGFQKLQLCGTRFWQTRTDDPLTETTADTADCCCCFLLPYDRRQTAAV